MSKQQICERWTRLIRAKAFEYEVPQRENGEGNEITNPDLFDIANEIDAFFTGLIN